MALCLIAFARLAFAEGDPELAALPGRPQASGSRLGGGRGRCCDEGRPMRWTIRRAADGRFVLASLLDLPASHVAITCLGESSSY